MPTLGPSNPNDIFLVSDGVLQSWNQFDGGPSSVTGDELAATPGGLGQVYYFGSPPNSTSVTVTPTLYISDFDGLIALTSNDKIDEIRVNTTMDSSNNGRDIGIFSLFLTKNGENVFTRNKAIQTTTQSDDLLLQHTFSSQDLSIFSGADVTSSLGVLLRMGLYGTNTGSRRARLKGLTVEIDYTVDGLLPTHTFTNIVAGSRLYIEALAGGDAPAGTVLFNGIAASNEQSIIYNPGSQPQPVLYRVRFASGGVFYKTFEAQANFGFNNLEFFVNQVID